MTVHVHRGNQSVGYGDHRHDAPTDSVERTWSFDCNSECEERILRDVEHTGRNQASVPMTVEEIQEQEALETMGKRDVTQMAMGMSEYFKQRAKEETAATSAA